MNGVSDDFRTLSLAVQNGARALALGQTIVTFARGKRSIFGNMHLGCLRKEAPARGFPKVPQWTLRRRAMRTILGNRWTPLTQTPPAGTEGRQERRERSGELSCASGQSDSKGDALI